MKYIILLCAPWAVVVAVRVVVVAIHIYTVHYGQLIINWINSIAKRKCCLLIFMIRADDAKAVPAIKVENVPNVPIGSPEWLQYINKYKYVIFKYVYSNQMELTGSHISSGDTKPPIEPSSCSYCLQLWRHLQRKSESNKNVQ